MQRNVPSFLPRRCPTTAVLQLESGGDSAHTGLNNTRALEESFETYLLFRFSVFAPSSFSHLLCSICQRSHCQRQHQHTEFLGLRFLARSQYPQHCGWSLFLPFICGGASDSVIDRGQVTQGACSQRRCGESPPCEVAESVIRRPQNTSLWTGSGAECRNAVCVGVLRNCSHAVSAHWSSSTESPKSNFPVFPDFPVFWIFPARKSSKLPRWFQLIRAECSPNGCRKSVRRSSVLPGRREGPIGFLVKWSEFLSHSNLLQAPFLCCTYAVERVTSRAAGYDCVINATVREGRV